MCVCAVFPAYCEREDPMTNVTLFFLADGLTESFLSTNICYFTFSLTHLYVITACGRTERRTQSGYMMGGVYFCPLRNRTVPWSDFIDFLNCSGDISLFLIYREEKKLIFKSFPLMYVLLIYTSLPSNSFSVACSILLMLILSFDWLRNVWGG